MRHTVTLLACSAATAPAHAAETFADALREGDVIFDLRVRYESVEQDGFTTDADALTNRLRAGFQTAPLEGTWFLVEGVVVDDLEDDYNSTTNGHGEYPVVADPADFAAINRLAVTNKSLERTTLTFGRQRIVHDDQRFVGNVGWRQHEQTFDGLRAQWASPKIKTDLAYAAQVNRVFGPDSPQGEWEGDVVLASFAYALPAGTLTLFDYYLDVDEAASASTNTVGVKLAGSKPFGKVTATYSLAAARQAEAGSNAVDVGADYGLVEGGLAFTKLGLAFHDYDADFGGAHFGEELNVQLVARTERMALTAKYADYRADALLTDTTKLWFSVEYAF